MITKTDKACSADVLDPTVAAMAYLGDAVIELLVRERLVKEGLCGAAALNEAALRYVRAAAQSEAVERILPHLSEREAGEYRRGRNANGKNHPRSASVAEYRRATGLEVLFGRLYLSGEQARLRELFDLAYPRTLGE